jgi:hypothetical protein
MKTPWERLHQDLHKVLVLVCLTQAQQEVPQFLRMAMLDRKQQQQRPSP